ncbi:MAG: AMP-binding protein, partial [Candidatus Delongbacteria bacterium]|nr:AMP-binding protein [Candidatus Delongbacteria bacterium]
MNNFKNLSHSQKRILLTEIIHTDLEMSNVGLLVKINIPNFTPKFLELSINYLIESDDGTRMRLRNNKVEDYIEQYVEEYKSFEVDYHDSSNKTLDYTISYFKEVHREKFNLFNSSLFYFCMVKFSDNTGGFYLKAHHLISDGNSAVITINKVIKKYKHLLNNEEISLEQSIPYIHYLESESKYLTSRRFNEDKKYWEKQYKTPPKMISLSQEVKKANSLETGRKYFTLGAKMSTAILNFKKENNLSLFNIFLEIFSLYIFKYSLIKDFTIGIPTHNRYDKKFDNSIGMFVSSLPFRVLIDEEKTLKEFHAEVKTHLWSSLKHQKYPYDLLIHKLVSGSSSEVDLLNFQLVEVPSFNRDDIEIVQHYSSQHSLSEISLFINLRDKLKDGIIEIAIDYQKDIFSYYHIELMFERIEMLLESYLYLQDKKISELNILCKTELDLLSKFNDTQDNTNLKDNVISQFQKSVEMFPDSIAVSDDKKYYSYKKLEIATANLANDLTSNKIDGSNTVAIIMKNSVETIIGIIGILRAGFSYLPIDPSTPQERVSYMLKDCEISIILTTSDIEINLFEDLSVLYLDLLTPLNDECVLKEDPSIKFNKTAYTIYTSGSIGNPKGVSLNHGNLSNYINWAKNYYKLKEKFIFPLYSSISFDLTITSVFVPLSSGGQIVVYNDEDFENAFLRIFKENLVNTVKLTPSHLRIIQNINFDNSSIKQLIVGGEELTFNLAR